ncbi:efflux transporter outer membrane subunit [Sphingosinicella microcystinivorans]|uniref:efflux transporter outer membrane subunit n=1 Tax=Sphingosinicella microcystinivorans TaxID=335406 RepID=UPI0022F39657|nr:efflux transporter outer membrane subunit [Sphingosinicella microcystinivorans]WBX84496.1 efflux transporter outer membrane subunit [Sphingosinicella microcystinivorans]
MRKLLLLSALLVSASACQMAPKHERPALPTAPAYPLSPDPADGTRAETVGWRDFFADPALRTLIGTALERNRDLAVSIARIEEARGLYRIQRADRLPTLAASGEAARSRGQVVTPTGVTVAEQDRFSVGVGVSAFELDFWGRVRNLSEAARSQYLSTVQAERAFRLSLIRDVATTWFALRETEERITLAEATVKSREDGVRIAQRRLDAGVTSALDFRQAESLLTQAETELAGLRLSRSRNANFLAVLVGGVLPETAQPLPLAEQDGFPRLAAGLPSDLLTLRPDILAAEETLRAARANVGAARAAFFPTISLTGTLGFASGELDSLFENDSFNWSVGPTLNLPIFDFGRRKGNLTVAEAREDIAVAGYEQTVQLAFREVADALAGRRFLAEQMLAQMRATEAQRHIAQLARTRYREGVVGYLEVLDAERNLFDAEQALITASRAVLDNRVSLYVALGGGLVESAAP